MEVKGVAKCYVGPNACIFVRTKANDLDKVIFNQLVKDAARELINGGSPRISKDLARLFICGWSGFNSGDHFVPYSWDLLEATIPADEIRPLEKFVAANVDILKQ